MIGCVPSAGFGVLLSRAGGILAISWNLDLCRLRKFVTGSIQPIQVQGMTWGTKEEAAHAVASLDNILPPDKQDLVQYCARMMISPWQFRFFLFLFFGWYFTTFCTAFHLISLISLSELRTSEDIRSRFVAAGIVQPLVALLSDGSMDTRWKALLLTVGVGWVSVVR